MSKCTFSKNRNPTAFKLDHIEFYIWQIRFEIGTVEYWRKKPWKPHLQFQSETRQNCYHIVSLRPNNKKCTLYNRSHSVTDKSSDFVSFWWTQVRYTRSQFLSWIHEFGFTNSWKTFLIALMTNPAIFFNFDIILK